MEEGSWRRGTEGKEGEVRVGGNVVLYLTTELNFIEFGIESGYCFYRDMELNIITVSEKWREGKRIFVAHFGASSYGLEHR